MSNLVSTAWLAAHLNDANLVVLDATWHLPNLQRNAFEEYESSHIPGARFFDLDKTSDQTSPLPHMLPTASDFAFAMQRLGIGNASHVLAYDSYGLFSAARCWWMFKVFGHEKVSVLDGGLKKWLAEGRATSRGQPSPPPISQFSATLKPHMVRNSDEVATTSAQIVDARSPARFRGEEPEPRPGVKPGHVPGAHNLHYARLLTAEGTLKPQAELAEAFASAGINPQKPVITSCGSGVTAAIITLALTQLAAPNHALYDGSWAQWGSSGRPVASE